MHVSFIDVPNSVLETDDGQLFTKTIGLIKHRGIPLLPNSSVEVYFNPRSKYEFEVEVYHGGIEPSDEFSFTLH